MDTALPVAIYTHPANTALKKTNWLTLPDARTLNISLTRTPKNVRNVEETANASTMLPTQIGKNVRFQILQKPTNALKGMLKTPRRVSATNARKIASSALMM